MRFDHFGYESRSRLYDNSRVEPESWEEQFTEALADQATNQNICDVSDEVSNQGECDEDSDGKAA